jgi:hypothetical protein
VKAAKFQANQPVSFLGGVGTIKSCRIDSGNWVYAIEMAIESGLPTPSIGSEAMILLHEPDIETIQD